MSINHSVGIANVAKYPEKATRKCLQRRSSQYYVINCVWILLDHIRYVEKGETFNLAPLRALLSLRIYTRKEKIHIHPGR